MRKLKKICSIIVAHIMVLSIVLSPLDAMAAGAPQFSVEDCTVLEGDEFTVDITLDNATNVFGGNFTLQYDNDMLEVSKYEFGDILSNYTKNCNLDYQSAGNLIRFTFSGSEAVATDGVVLTLTFVAKEHVQGETDLAFDSYKFYGTAGSALDGTAIGGAVTIESRSTYSTLELYAFQDGELSEKITQNVYEFTAPESAYYQVSYYDKSYNDIKLKWVVHSDGTVLRTHEGTPEPEFFQFMNEGETYYFVVSKLDNNTETTSYRCIVRMVEQELTVGEETLDQGGFFLFKPEESGTYRFYDATHLSTTFKIYDLDFNLLAGGGADIFTTNTERVVCELEGGQTYFLDVWDWGASMEDCYVGVKKLHGEPASIEIDWTEEDYTLEQGSYVRLNAIILPEDCIAGDVTWTTSNESVVSFMEESNKRGITFCAGGTGTAVITATLDNGLSDSITITVVGGSEPDVEPDEEVTLTSVEIENMPSKTVYEIGETLDTNGLKLRFTYSNGSSGITDFGYTTSGFDSTTAGSKTVTVEYGGLTTSFTVTVNEEQASEDSAQLIMSGLETMAGKEITVTLSVENNPGIAGLAVSLKYDESVLTLKDTENGGLFSGFTAGKNFAWDESEDVVEDGVLATYTFVVVEDAPAGDYDLEVIIRSCTNENLDDVELLTVNGKISVIDFIYGDSNGDQEIDMKDVVLLRKYITNFDYDTDTSSENVDFGADANGDDKIDMKDVVILRKYITNYDYDTDSSTVVLGPQ